MELSHSDRKKLRSFCNTLMLILIITGVLGTVYEAFYMGKGLYGSATTQTTLLFIIVGLLINKKAP